MRFDDLRQDLRHTLRQLRKDPGFTAVALLTLALGIGANSAIFSVVNGVLLRPLPYPEPDRLVILWEDYTARGGPEREWHSYPNFADWRAESRSFEEMAVWQGGQPILTGSGGEPERVPGAQVTHGFFPTLGVQPALGRAFLEEEDAPGGPPVVLLSHGLWERRFGGDPAVVGRTVVVNGVEQTVIGVLPRGFRYQPLGDVDLWQPLGLDAASSCGRACVHLRSVARLRPGVTPEAAEAELRTIAARLEAEYPQSNTGVSASVFPMRDEIVGDVRPAMLVLLGAVGFVLLIACANIASLVLARGERRRAEVAVRTALGAERGRLVRQLLTESLVLALIGGALAVGLAAAAVAAFPAFAPPDIPRLEEVGIDLAVLGFTLAVTVVAGLLFGLAPALIASRPDVASYLKEGGRSETGRAGSGRVRSGLVVGQVALSLVLLVGAGLLLRSFVELRRADLGFEPEGVLTANLFLPPSRYEAPEAVEAFYRELFDRLEGLPGVRRAAGISGLPLSGGGTDIDFYIEGRRLPSAGEEEAIWYRIATPDYFATVGLRLLSGRPFDEDDRVDGPSVLLVNRSAAERYWPGEDPVGARLTFGDPSAEDATWREVVGVVDDVRHFGVAAGEQAAVYLPWTQIRSRGLNLVLRTSGEPERIAGAVRSELAAMDDALALTTLRPMTELVDASLAEARFFAALLALFAGVALVLAAVGIYGVLSYLVARRTHEVGIRMALGARREDVLRLMLGRGMLLAALGLGLGLLVAVWGTRVLSGLLFRVRPSDPLTFVAVAILLAAVAFVACWVPARRATRVDPLIALRAE